MESKLKKVKGITLIALVITIIVILILAGVSITMITSQDGILKKATGAKEKNEKAKIEDAGKLEYSSWLIEYETGETKKTADEYIKEKLKADGFKEEEVDKIYISDKGQFYNDVRVLTISDGDFTIENGILRGKIDNSKITEETLLIPATMDGKPIKKINNDDYSDFDSALGLGDNIHKIIIGEGIECIGNSAFSAASIEEIVIASTVKNIASNAFSNCLKLEKITIPSTVTYVGQIFYYSYSEDYSNIKEIVFEGKNPPDFDEFGIISGIVAPYNYGGIGTISAKIKVPKGSEEKYLNAILDKNQIVKYGYYTEANYETLKAAYENAIVGY